MSKNEFIQRFMINAQPRQEIDYPVVIDIAEAAWQELDKKGFVEKIQAKQSSEYA